MNSDDLDAAVAYVSNTTEIKPKLAIILGSGLGGLADRMEVDAAISYSRLPGFGTSSAQGHRGELILGEFGGLQTVAMAGRFHRYEGWTIQQIGYPVRLMHALGARTLIASNAAGGVNPKLRVGDIVVIRDHINWLANLDPSRTIEASTDKPESIQRSGHLYDPHLSELARRTAIEQQFNACDGTYLATLGPNYETRSEYRMMRRMGVDVVGMSTVPEVLAASDLGMRTVGLSMVSNVASPDRAVKADHADVLAAGRAAERNMEAIVKTIAHHLSIHP